MNERVLDVCMYVCMYEYMYVRMYVCMYVCNVFLDRRASKVVLQKVL